jgi:hypothetical protein
MYAETLSRIVGALEAAHRARCPCGSPHTCPLAPGVWGVADALDAWARDEDDVRGVALALHDRECRRDECPSAVEEPGRETAVIHARQAQASAAGAIVKFARATS